MKLHLTATECYLPYGITQSYLQPDTSEHTLTPARQAGTTRFTDPGGIEGWVDLGDWLQSASASSSALVVPATRRSSLGDRAFAVAGPRARNSLLEFVTDCSSPLTCVKRPCSSLGRLRLPVRRPNHYTTKPPVCIIIRQTYDRPERSLKLQCWVVLMMMMMMMIKLLMLLICQCKHSQRERVRVVSVHVVMPTGHVTHGVARLSNGHRHGFHGQQSSCAQSDVWTPTYSTVTLNMPGGSNAAQWYKKA